MFDYDEPKSKPSVDLAAFLSAPQRWLRVLRMEHARVSRGRVTTTFIYGDPESGSDSDSCHQSRLERVAQHTIRPTPRDALSDGEGSHGGGSDVSRPEVATLGTAPSGQHSQERLRA